MHSANDNFENRLMHLYPDEAKELESAREIHEELEDTDSFYLWCGLICGSLPLAILWVAPTFFGSEFIGLWVGLPFLAGVYFLFRQHRMTAHHEASKKKYASLRSSCEKLLIEHDEQTRDDAREILEMISEKDALALGNKISLGDISGNFGTTIIVGSELSNSSISSSSVSNDELVDALKTLSGYVETNGDESSAKALGELKKAVEKGEDKSTIAQAWTHLVAALPSITSMVKATESILKLFV